MGKGDQKTEEQEEERKQDWNNQGRQGKDLRSRKKKTTNQGSLLNLWKHRTNDKLNKQPPQMVPLRWNPSTIQKADAK